MRIKHVTLTCGDEFDLASLTLEQLDAIQESPAENAETAMRQAVCDSLNNAAGDPQKWTLETLNKRFDIWDVRELVPWVQKVSRMVDVGEAEASELTVSKFSLA